MYVTTEFRPSPSFLQPTSKPKGVAAGRNPPFVFGRSRCRRSAPRSWTRHHQANNPPFSNLPLLMMLLRSPGGFAAPKAASRAAADVLSAAPFPRTHPRAPTPPAPTPRPRLQHPRPRPTHATRRHPADAAAAGRVSQFPRPRASRRRRTAPWPVLPRVPTQPALEHGT